MRRSAPGPPTLTTPADELAPAKPPNVVPPMVALLTDVVPPVAAVAAPVVVAPCPRATDPATLALDPRPIATPEVAPEVTTDCPPIAMASLAAAEAPPLLFVPIAVAPLPLAVAVRPRAEEKSPAALAPEPMATERFPFATAAVPSARAFSAPACAA